MLKITPQNFECRIIQKGYTGPLVSRAKLYAIKVPKMSFGTLLLFDCSVKQLLLILGE